MVSGHALSRKFHELKLISSSQVAVKVEHSMSDPDNSLEERIDGLVERALAKHLPPLIERSRREAEAHRTGKRA